jgi:hypothetical protein
MAESDAENTFGHMVARSTETCLILGARKNRPYDSSNSVQVDNLEYQKEGGFVFVSSPLRRRANRSGGMFTQDSTTNETLSRLR